MRASTPTTTSAQRRRLRPAARLTAIRRSRIRGSIRVALDASARLIVAPASTSWSSMKTVPSLGRASVVAVAAGAATLRPPADAASSGSPAAR